MPIEEKETLKKLVKENGLKLRITGVHDSSGWCDWSSSCEADNCITCSKCIGSCQHCITVACVLCTISYAKC